jgi:hypothetical protein
MFLGELNRFVPFSQGKCASNEWCWIDFTQAKKFNRFGKGTAARANYGELLHYDGPGFHGRRAVECGFQDERATGLGQMLGES